MAKSLNDTKLVLVLQRAITRSKLSYTDKQRARLQLKRRIRSYVKNRENILIVDVK